VPALFTFVYGLTFFWANFGPNMCVPGALAHIIVCGSWLRCRHRQPLPARAGQRSSSPPRLFPRPRAPRATAYPPPRGRLALVGQNAVRVFLSTNVMYMQHTVLCAISRYTSARIMLFVVVAGFFCCASSGFALERLLLSFKLAPSRTPGKPDARLRLASL
jgi:hypothetical protein